MPSLEVGGNMIAYERRGDGHAIVVVNGFAGTRADWDPDFVDALAGGHELVLLDNRGMGESSGGRAEFRIEDLAADTAGAIEALELERPCLLGWSMGGAVAMELALSQPELAGSLVLLASHPGGNPVFASAEVKAKLADVSVPPRVQASRVISALFMPERAAGIDARFGDVVAEARAALDPEVVANQVRALDGWEAGGRAERLGGIGCPVLVAVGAEDQVIRPAASREMAAAIDGAWYARFDATGHAFMADHPEAVAGLIGSFLRAQR
jgi:pimeloyl-ACP methyl ester carboxylesterase